MSDFVSEIRLARASQSTVRAWIRSISRCERASPRALKKSRVKNSLGLIACSRGGMIAVRRPTKGRFGEKFGQPPKKILSGNGSDKPATPTATQSLQLGGSFAPF